MSNSLKHRSNKRFVINVECSDNLTVNELFYRLGYYKPKYPLPAVPVHVGFQRGSAKNPSYVWICSARRLWTIWENGPLIEETI